MAPRNENNHHRDQYAGGEIEFEMSGSRNGTRAAEFVPVDLTAADAPTAAPAPKRKPLLKRFAGWIRKPMNLVVFLWGIPVFITLLLMVVLMAGGIVPQKSRREDWMEVNNQIMNALFTVGCLFTHPEVFYHLMYVVRWRPADQEAVRGVYCSTKTPEPRDRKHLFVVVGLINLTWVGQYVMCGLYWAYNRHNRPMGVMNFWMVITLVAPLFASIYTVKGPLKTKKTAEELRADAEARAAEDNECKLRFCRGGDVVASPEWDGGVVTDWCHDSTVGATSFFCMFCVFGRNTNRLGLGNRNMHVVTFFIAVVSPFVVFLIASLKVNNDGVQVVMIVSGALMSWAGFFYGGYWRVRMREKFGLPENDFCLGVPFLTDYFAWLLCAPCALAQEVRTANAYDIEEGQHELGALPRGNSKANSMAPPRAPSM